MYISVCGLVVMLICFMIMMVKDKHRNEAINNEDDRNTKNEDDRNTKNELIKRWKRIK